MREVRRWLYVLFAAACFTSSACAQDSLLDDARTRLKNRDASGAYALLVAAETARAGDVRFDYLLGIAALDAGHVTHAIFALERVVQLRPGDMLARAELGRAYLAAGEIEAAREQWSTVRSAQLPDGAAEAIERVIGVVAQVAPSSSPFVSGYLELGVAYDSNVNSANNQGEFAIPAFGGILFQTAPENRQRHDAGAIAAAGFNAQKALSPGWQLVVSANVSAGVNRVAHDMDTAFLDATVGLRHAADNQSQLVALQNYMAWVGGSPYRTASGLVGQWQWQLDATTQASAFAQWSRQVYQAQSERNTDRLLLGLGGAHRFVAAESLVYGSVYGVQERARTRDFDEFGHHGAGLRLGVEQRLGVATTAFGEWKYERRHYGGTEPFFETARHDGQNDFSAGLRWNAGPRWQWVAQARRARLTSNIALYAYTRNVFQITAHRSFQ